MNSSKKINKKLPVKLIVGFIFKDELFLKKAIELLKKRFGDIDYESKIMNFTHTDYYEKEFGKDLKRKFISFRRLIYPQNLYKIKLFTNSIEKKLSQNNLRKVNIDPGYLDLSKLILASTKDYRHRIYLDRGIYAEVTLFYQNKTFCAWEWTYPDYKTSEYIAIFNQIREIYAQQLKKEFAGSMVRKLRNILITLVKTNDTPQRISLGLGLGVFLGLLPGTGPIASIFLSTLFRLNVPACLSASLLTNSWLSLVTFILSVKIGSAIMGLEWQEVLKDYAKNIRSFSWWEIFKLSAFNVILPIMLGYIMVGLILGGLVYLISLITIKRIKKDEAKRRINLSR